MFLFGEVFTTLDMFCNSFTVVQIEPLLNIILIVEEFCFHFSKMIYLSFCELCQQIFGNEVIFVAF